MSMSNTLDFLERNPRFVEANENSRLLAAFVLDTVRELTGVNPIASGASGIAGFPHQKKKKARFGIVLERINKTNGSITFSLDLSKEIIIKLGYGCLIAKSWSGYTRIRTSSLDDEAALIEILQTAIC